jgi:hypothetical protein
MCCCFSLMTITTVPNNNVYQIMSKQLTSTTERVEYMPGIWKRMKKILQRGSTTPVKWNKRLDRMSTASAADVCTLLSGRAKHETSAMLNLFFYEGGFLSSCIQFVVYKHTF